MKFSNNFAPRIKQMKYDYAVDNYSFFTIQKMNILILKIFYI